MKIFSLNGDIEQGRPVSFEEVDKEFSTFCSFPGCRKRLINYFRACIDVSVHILL